MIKTYQMDTVYSIGLVFLLLAWEGGAHAANGLSNLLPNGSFEDEGPPWKMSANDPAKSGAMVVSNSPQAKEGRQSAMLSLPVQGSASLASPLAPVAMGEDYLFSLWYRSEGFNKDGRYAGVSASYQLIWYSADKKVLDQLIIGLPYGAQTEWSLQIRALTAPRDAAYLGLFINMSANDKCPPSTLWIDRIQLVHWPSDFNASGKTVTFHIGTQGNFAQELFRRVWDDDAEDGFAVIANTRFNTRPGYLAGSMYTRLLSPGAYRVTYRVKVGDVPLERKPVLQWDINTDDMGRLREGILYPDDFVAAKAYQNFTYRFVLAPNSGWVDFRAYWPAWVTTWIDTITVREEKELTKNYFKMLFE